MFALNNESFVADKNHSYDSLTHDKQVAIRQMFEIFGGMDNMYHMQNILGIMAGPIKS